ncbi:MAG TPA: hypothetical protein VFH64_04510, partial [Amnibacterium sp.]|nr:hypothetical protein [Amnibacterium sp.]
MADDRTRAQAAAGPDEEIHDDDELAAALAAELERIAPTGAVPVLRASAVPFGPARSADAPAPRASLEAVQRSPVPMPPPARSVRSGEPARARRDEEPASPAAQEQPSVRPEALAPRSARPQRPGPTPDPDPDPLGQHSRHAGTSARHAGGSARAARSRTESAPLVVERDRSAADQQEPGPQSARIPGFSRTTAAGTRPETAPGRRRAASTEPGNTQPVRLPGRVLADPEPLDLQDPLRETGPLALPTPLYESWEQSLRSIGRPRDDEWLDSAVADHADPDAATVALSRAALGPLPDPPARELPPQPPEPEQVEQVEPRRRRRARRSAQPEAEPEAQPAPAGAIPKPAVVTDHAVAEVSAPAPAPFAPAPFGPAPIAEEERDGVDEVDTGIRA